MRGHIYPQTTGARLAETFGAISYIDKGVNGATCLTFTHPDRITEIAALKPELLILSLDVYKRQIFAVGWDFRNIMEIIKNYLKYSLWFVLIVFAALLGLHWLPVLTIDGHTMRRVDLLSDLRYPESEIATADSDSIPLPPVVKPVFVDTCLLYTSRCV